MATLMACQGILCCDLEQYESISPKSDRFSLTTNSLAYRVADIGEEEHGGASMRGITGLDICIVLMAFHCKAKETKE
jgi:hypothetical protein